LLPFFLEVTSFLFSTFVSAFYLSPPPKLSPSLPSSMSGKTVKRALRSQTSATKAKATVEEKHKKAKLNHQGEGKGNQGTTKPKQRQKQEQRQKPKPKQRQKQEQLYPGGECDDNYIIEKACTSTLTLTLPTQVLTTLLFH
jgi:hypothetical protein